MIKKIGRLFCHRKPHRLFRYGNFDSIFCFRCSGVYMGFTLGFLFLFLQGRFFISNVPFGVFLLLFPMPFDLVTKGKLRESNSYIRFATGLLFGFGIVPYLGISIAGPAMMFEHYMLFVLVVTMLLLVIQSFYERYSKLAKGFITLVNSTSFAAILILPFLILAWFFRMIVHPYFTWFQKII